MARQVNLQEDLLSDVLFSIPFQKKKKTNKQKNAWIMNLKNLVLDLN